MEPQMLPAPFADLQDLVAEWALPSERARYHKLHRSDISVVRTFYDRMLPRMPAILEHLDRHTEAALPDDARALYHLALTFAETAHPIDLGWKDVDFESAYDWEALEFRTVSL